MSRLRALVDLASGMVDAMAAEERLAAALAEHLSGYFAGAVSVWLRPADGGPMLVEVSGHRPELLRWLTSLVQSGCGAPHPSLAAGQPVLIWGDEYPGGGPGGLYVLPMSVRGRLVGVVAASVPAGESVVDDETLEFAISLVDTAAVTLVNARALADATAVSEHLRGQARILDEISDALIRLDAEHRVISWNAGAERLYGYPRADALGCDLFWLLATQFHRGDGEPMTLDDVCAAAVEAGGWKGEARERRADGMPLTVLYALDVVVDEAGVPRGYVLVIRDITDQRRDEHRALHDPLTGLANRRMLSNRLYDAFARSCRHGTSLAVLVVDLLQFRMMNDVYGREAGDEILRNTGNRLVAAVRGTDTVGRLQGDGFVVVLENAGTDENIAMAADRIAQALNEPIQAGDDVIQVRPTIGAILVTGCDGLDATPEGLIELADKARHLAKAAGDTFTLERLTPTSA